MPENTRTARQTVELMLHALAHNDRETIDAVYSPDVVVTNPFAPDGVPARVEGAEELKARRKDYAGLWRYESVENVTLHETADLEVVIAEFTVTGTVTASANPFRLSFVTVMRIVDGLITESRDYSDGVRTANLFAEIQPAAG